ncbi:hypothetical protein C5167_042765, partial [Papaver somniferum]
MVNMPLPDILPMPPTYVSEKVCKNVGVLGDCIFVAFIWRSVRMDVWVMREYGVNESWFRKYTTTQLPLSLYPSAFWKPLWCFDGEVLVDDGTEHFLLFDPTTETFRSVVVSDIAMDSLRNRVTYVESIASLGSGTYLKRQIKDGTGKNPKRQRLSGSALVQLALQTLACFNSKVFVVKYLAPHWVLSTVFRLAWITWRSEIVPLNSEQSEMELTSLFGLVVDLAAYLFLCDLLWDPYLRMCINLQNLRTAESA